MTSDPSSWVSRMLIRHRPTRRATLRTISRGGLLAAVNAVAGPSARFSRPAAAHAVAESLDPDTADSITRALWLPESGIDRLPADVVARLADPKNANRAFGERMAYRLRELLAHPDTFLPSYEQRYQTLLTFCDTLSPHQAYAMSGLLGGDKSRGFAQLAAPADLRFPAAHGMALQTETGWYFLVGSCWDRAGAEYGVEFMLFRYALLPPPIARHFGLSDAENQVMELQFGVTRVGERHLQAKPIVVAGTTGLLGFATDAIGASLGKNAFQQLDPHSTFPLRVQARGTYDGPDGPLDLSIDLTLDSGRDPLLQGADGCSPCCGGVGTHYYSIPNIRLDPAASTLTLRGEEIALGDGRFWFDHQWSNGLGGGAPRSAALRAATNLAPAAPEGWDWFMAQFDDNRQLTFAAQHTNENRAFYYQTGPTPPGTMTATVAGKYIERDGSAQDVTGEMTVAEWIRSEDTPDPAQYWPTNAWYPNHWSFRLDPALPDEVRTFTMTPIVKSGQSGFFASGEQYSEGAVELRDADGTVVGRGFAESVDYADATSNVLALAGLPVTAEMIALFQTEEPTATLAAESAAYVAAHADELADALETCLGLTPGS